ncbi:hypothetical protein [Lachnobacterium bovis]|uniref:hypothetical protein n=1 Tax=Lachnobacterium bovis TaxID=140626 RepID=UPI0004869112|nr:hypothetical protein [Lachnobacterium bovis]
MPIVDDFNFEDDQEALKAKKEVEGIKYVKTKGNLENVNHIIKIYSMLIEKEYFSTLVGINFMVSLRKKAIELGAKEEQLPTIFVPKKKEIEVDDGKAARRELAQFKKHMVSKEEFNSVKKKKRFFTFLTVIFGLSIIGMFAIMFYTRSTTTIVNYETKIINKYEAWNKKLNKKEKELNKKAQYLNSLEKKIKKIQNESDNKKDSVVDDNKTTNDNKTESNGTN